MTRARNLWTIPWLALLPTWLPAQTLVPLGSKFTISSPDTQSSAPAVCSGAAGNFVVVWKSSATGSQGEDPKIVGRRYNPRGTALDNEIEIADTIPDSTHPLDLACNRRGDFVVTWIRQDEAEEELVVSGQRFNHRGSTLGGVFEAGTNDFADEPAIASDAKGNFVLVWAGRDDADQGATAISGQRYNATGKAMGPVFQPRTGPGDLGSPRVSMTERGPFLVVWERLDPWSESRRIEGQLYSASGREKGDRLRVVSAAAAPEEPALTSKPAGDFVVAWTASRTYSSSSSCRQSSGQINPNSGLYGPYPYPYPDPWPSPSFCSYDKTGVSVKELSDQGQPQNSRLELATPGGTEGIQLSSDRFGNVLAIWSDGEYCAGCNPCGSGGCTVQIPGSDPTGPVISAQLLSSSGDPLGNSFIVPSSRIAPPLQGESAATQDGFVVVWQGLDEAGGAQIFGQRFRLQDAH